MLIFRTSERLTTCPQVLDELENPADLNVNAGGKIIEYHGCDFFPERFFQLVVVLRTDNTLLWDRLEKRCAGECACVVVIVVVALTPSQHSGYVVPKIQENVEAEIMQVILEEARESYKADIIQVRSSCL